MRNTLYSNLDIGLIGFVCGTIAPILLVVVLKFSAIQICRPGKLMADFAKLNSSFDIFTSTEIVGIYSVLLTILFYAMLFSMIFVGFNFLFGSRVQRH